MSLGRKMVVKGAFALLVAVGMLSAAMPAGAQAASVRYVRGWTIQQGMLCYGYASGVYHCTSHWHAGSGGALISERTSFVPSKPGNGGGAPPASNPPPTPQPQPSGSCKAAGVPAIGYVANGMHWAPGGIPNDVCAAVLPAPYGGALSLWKVPPAPYNKVYYVNPKLYPGRPNWPVCSWWAREMDGEYPTYWGYHNHGNTPAVGATIKYEPHVLGAGGWPGHVGHVVAVYSNGWVLSSEMNFYWRGGGAGKVIFRFVPAHTRGVSFWY